MTLPIEKVCKHIFTRITENNTRVDVERVGNWIEVRYNTIKIGRTRSKTMILAPDGVDFDECLVLPDYVILLSHEEVAEVNFAMNDDVMPTKKY